MCKDTHSQFATGKSIDFFVSNASLQKVLAKISSGALYREAEMLQFLRTFSSFPCSPVQAVTAPLSQSSLSPQAHTGKVWADKNGREGEKSLGGSLVQADSWHLFIDPESTGGIRMAFSS